MSTGEELSNKIMVFNFKTDLRCNFVEILLILNEKGPSTQQHIPDMWQWKICVPQTLTEITQSQEWPLLIAL